MWIYARGVGINNHLAHYSYREFIRGIFLPAQKNIYRADRACPFSRQSLALTGIKDWGGRGSEIEGDLGGELLLLRRAYWDNIL